MAGLRFDAADPTCISICKNAQLLETHKATFDRELLANEMGKEEFGLIDDTEASPEVPRLKWSFQELCKTQRECAEAYSRINDLTSKLLR